MGSLDSDNGRVAVLAEGAQVRGSLLGTRMPPEGAKPDLSPAVDTDSSRGPGISPCKPVEMEGIQGSGLFPCPRPAPVLPAMLSEGERKRVKFWQPEHLSSRELTPLT